MKELALPLDRRAIEDLIPHRDPFLFVDEVTAVVLDHSIVAHKTVSERDAILAGHFPGKPIFPGVIMVEAAAQAAGVLGRLGFGKTCTQIFLAEVGKSRFRRIVVPGDRLTMNVQLKKSRAPFYWFTATLDVSGELAAEVEFSAKMF
jgi:3-hydroxyacyl-[acyl-carrier-protein] dehydratase